jgi:two-component system, OmpR family, KDP operon response regulator KdpE
MSLSKKVLLIDDDPVVVSLYRALFRHNGFEVIAAHDGAEGLELLRMTHPDAVLLDLSMPQIDGLEWLRTVRADSRYSKVPIVVLTMRRDRQLELARESGATTVLSKLQVNPDEVVATIVAVLDEVEGSG